MQLPERHRKRVRHYEGQRQVHELTFSCYHREPLLCDDERRSWLSRAIDAATQRHGFLLHAFVYMPEHVHLTVAPGSPSCRIEQLLYAIKRPFSYRVKQALLYADDPLATHLTVRERPGKPSFRFWQEGPGYDRNLLSPQSLLAAIEYMHLNPVRRGLCELPGQRRWSSWRSYNDPASTPDPDLPAVQVYTL